METDNFNIKTTYFKNHSTLSIFNLTQILCSLSDYTEQDLHGIENGQSF